MLDERSRSGGCPKTSAGLVYELEQCFRSFLNGERDFDVQAK